MRPATRPRGPAKASKVPNAAGCTRPAIDRELDIRRGTEPDPQSMRAQREPSRRAAASPTKSTRPSNDPVRIWSHDSPRAAVKTNVERGFFSARASTPAVRQAHRQAIAAVFTSTVARTGVRRQSDPSRRRRRRRSCSGPRSPSARGPTRSCPVGLSTGAHSRCASASPTASSRTTSPGHSSTRSGTGRPSRWRTRPTVSSLMSATAPAGCRTPAGRHHAPPISLSCREPQGPSGESFARTERADGLPSAPIPGAPDELSAHRERGSSSCQILLFLSSIPSVAQRFSPRRRADGSVAVHRIHWRHDVRFLAVRLVDVSASPRRADAEQRLQVAPLMKQLD